MEHGFQKLGILKSYVYPSLVLFASPIFSLWFFNHAESKFDRDMLASIEQGIQQDTEMSEEERAGALEFFRAVPVSRILKSNAPELQELRNSLPDETRFHYATFRWMIRLSVFCIIAGVSVFAITGLSVMSSRRSLRALYISLSAGWHVLRLFSTLQVIAQACLVVTLSFWITALWFGFYSVELMVIGGLVAAGSVLPVLVAIFKRVDDQFQINGAVLDRSSAAQLWETLAKLSTEVGTALPNQIIAGVDDNFFVTEQPLAVNDKTFTGRTLYVSLCLLKTLQEREAVAVLVHELAHFSGNDTLYSKKISPLLMRYQHYLEGLHAGVLSRPVFYCAVLFRALYEISLGRLSRQREFRADRIAAEKTSSDDFASALLRITAYSEYRQNVEKGLFDAQKVHANANIPERIEDGFQEFASSFAEKQDVGKVTTMHPFDSHPPLGQRLEALGFKATAESMRAVLSESADGIWFQNIPGAERLEKAQWSSYEERFRQFHEMVLAFRYLPNTDEERTLVERFFPEITLATYKGGSVVFDCEKISFEGWDAPVYYGEIESITAETEWGKPRLNLLLSRDGAQVCELPLSKEQSAQQELMGVLQHYSGRYAAAVAYQERLNESETGQNQDAVDPPNSSTSTAEH